MSSLNLGNAVTNLPVEIIEKLGQMNHFDPHDPTINSILEVGVEVGAAISMAVTPLYSDKFGFIKSLITLFALQIIASLASMIPLGWIYLAVVRIFTGMFTSALEGLAPLLVGEVLSPHEREKTMLLFSIFLNLGVVVSYTVNFLISFDYDLWFLTFSTSAVFCIVGMISVVLMMKIQTINRTQKRPVIEDPQKETDLDQINNNEGTLSEKMSDIDTNKVPDRSKDETETETDEEYIKTSQIITDTKLTQLQLSRLTYVTLALGSMQMFTGCDAIVIYASDIFQDLIDSPKSGLYGALIIGIVLVVSISLVAPFAERNKRRVMLMIGVVGSGVSEIIIGLCYYFKASHLWILCWIIIFFIFYNAGPEPCVYMFFSEMFPPRYKSKLNGIGWSANWIANIICVYAFDYFEGGEEQFIYTAFGILVLVLGISGTLLAPETFNKSLRDIEKQIRQWEWKKKLKSIKQNQKETKKKKFKLFNWNFKKKKSKSEANDNLVVAVKNKNVKTVRFDDEDFE